VTSFCIDPGHQWTAETCHGGREIVSRFEQLMVGCDSRVQQQIDGVRESRDAVLRDHDLALWISRCEHLCDR